MDREDVAFWLAAFVVCVLLSAGLAIGARVLEGDTDDRHNTYNLNLGGRDYVCNSYPNRNNLTVCKTQDRTVPLP